MRPRRLVGGGLLFQLRGLVGVVLLGASAAAAGQPTLVFGRIDLGLRIHSADGGGVEPGSRSRIGLRTGEDLGFGWRTALSLEQRFEPDTGTLVRVAPGVSASTLACTDQRLGLVISHYAYGALIAGRRPTPAADVALMADAWGGDTVAADSSRRLVQPACADGRRALPRSLTYRSVQFDGLSFELQWSTATASLPAAQRGASVLFAQGGTAAAIGLHRWRAGHWEAPAGLVVDAGPGRLLVGHTLAQGADGRSRFWSVAYAGFFRGGEWRLGWTSSRAAQRASAGKVAAGFHYPLSATTVAYVDASQTRGPGQAPTRAADVGLKHNF